MKMRYCTAWLALVFCFLGRVTAQQVSNVLHVDEAKIRLHLLPKMELELPLINTAERPLNGNVQLSLVYGDNSVHSQINSPFQQEPGSSVVRVVWGINQLPYCSPTGLGWYRLRYVLSSKNSGDFSPVQGTVQLGPLITDSFEVRLTAATSVSFGAKYPVHLRVDEPASGRPYAKVPVDVELAINGQTQASTQVVTDEAGYAITTFDLPSSLSSNNGTVTATAHRGEFKESQTINFNFARRPSLTVSTDKPLYQPGQAVHLRLLAFGPDKRAWKDAKVTVTIKDQEGNELFHNTIVTSQFGIAIADWDTPPKIRLGDYSIEAQTENSGSSGPVYARAQVRLSRYDLPGFTVTATPDRSYYLPGQDASVEVRADYLFGKPVQRAKVKVVQTNGRYWNFREQKWQSQESSPVENDLNETGKSVVKVSLQENFPSKSQRFYDLPMAAYVTDLSTGRTEQRRFTIRLSAQPIHIYLLPGIQLSTNTPWQLYIMASYADGTPAAVTGTLEGALPNEAGAFDQDPDMVHRRLLGKFHTNRLGVARVELAPPSEEFFVVYSQNPFQSPGWYENYGWRQNGMLNISARPYVNRSALLLIHAIDEKGGEGTYQEQMQVQSSDEYILVHADRTLYHPGEPIHVSVATNQDVEDMVLTVSSDAGLLVSQLIHPSHGRAELNVPWEPRFRGELQIAAHSILQKRLEYQSWHPRQSLQGMMRVIYPAKHELQVGLHLAHTTFRPGETATGDLRVRTPEGEGVESVLGLLVFDRAVAERFGADQDFGHGFGFSIFDYLDGYYHFNVAGVSYRSLLNLDSSKPFSEGLDLVAEAVLKSGSAYWGWNYGYWNYWGNQVASTRSGSDYAYDARSYFMSFTNSSMDKLAGALNKIYKETGVYPKSAEDLSAELKESGLDPAVLLDAWDIPYRPIFSVQGLFDVMSLVSNGVDKKPGTDDDFTVRTFYWPYYTKIGKAIDQAVAEHHARTRKYIRDYTTLRDELKTRNIDLDALRDPWGNPYTYKFEISEAYFEIRVESPGPDKRFDSKSKRSWDDVEAWFSRIHYFLDETDDLEFALARHFAETGKFPHNDKELEPVLEAARLTKERLVDPWGHPYYFAFSQQSRYGDRIQTRVYTAEGDRQRKTTDVTPVTQELSYIEVMSHGPQPGYPVMVAEFSQLIAEQSAKELAPVPTPNEPPRSADRGGIAGVVTDPQGAVIANAQVTASTGGGKQKYDTTTDKNGMFSFASLPVGAYRLEIRAQGFQRSIVLGIPVKSANTTKVDASLQIGRSSETVEVTSLATMVEGTPSFGLPLNARNITMMVDGMAVSEKASKAIGPPESPAAKQLFTPRVRQYFPETMLWRPEVVTDAKGEAHISFPMGDTITAWRMSVVASTESGQVGVADQELHTFQPFFVEHDPPKVLTQGDRISLPVVLRNYTSKVQSIMAELKPEDWFSMLSSRRQNVTVLANQDAKAIFSFQAASSTRHGKQQVTARNATTGDAVEREVLVHPDGNEISFAVGKLLAGDDNSISVQIPANTLGDWKDAELRIYPNLMAHVFDAMHGVGSRPVGCGEQITSVGYINLLALQLLKKGGQDNSNAGNPRASIAVEARRSVQETYDKLSTLQMSDGGFGYWHDKSDVALTAYVLRFLIGAGEFIHVDPNLTARARKFLSYEQSKSGAWLRYDWYKEEDKEDANLTAYVTRALALATAKTSVKDRESELSVARALEYLEDEIGSWRDPYLVGNYALASATTGRKEYRVRAQSLLNSLAHNEGPATYWNLEANTSPFYGWGFGGRLETTALAIEALAGLRSETGDNGNSEQISRGLQYLLTHKDRYAMWYSTQATQNVIEAMIAALPPSQEQSEATQASLVVNGRTVSMVQIPAGNTVVGPTIFELGPYLHKGDNQVQIVRAGGLSALNAAMLVSYYVPWGESPATEQESVERGDTRALRLKVSLDHPVATVDEPVTCHVETERIGFKGYGMMMAEIGLPPGVDVERDSLEVARQFGEFYGYEVLPDRIVFYVWPRAGGSAFTFRFRPRFRMEAMTAVSVIYDYYNPDARATVIPTRFTVR